MTQNSIESILSKWSQKCDVLDVELIISHVLGKDRVFIMTHPEYTFTKNYQEQISSSCKKRANGYPLAYILGYKEFYSRNFMLNEHTLVPRPETEILIEQIIDFILEKKIENILILDIGTGSGIIAITLAKELEIENIQTKIIASDISAKALAVAKLNAQSHKANITFYKSNLLNDTKLQNEIIQTNFKNIIIVSNLPYVDIAQKKSLLEQPESHALHFEPSRALWSPENGLAHYKKLITQTIKITRNNQLQNLTSFYEIDSDQTNLFTQYLHSKLPISTDVKYFKDLSEKNRVARWIIT
jgi:release factor glutamine methyltransferase